jgi:hypothetical protein
MSRKPKSIMNAETNLIRSFMEQNLELGKTHNDIIKELDIPRATYFRHVKRIMDEDAKIWDKVHMDSAQYRATRLIQHLEECINLCKQIMNDPNTSSRDKIEAAKTLCMSEAHIFKLVNEGPTFKTSIDVIKKSPFDNNNQESINDNNTKQLPN